MEKYSDLSDKLTELQVEQTSEVRKLFNEILEEYKYLEKRYNEVENECIDYETSTQLGLGCEVLKYGKIYNIIVKSDSFEECLKGIEKLYSLDIFECDSELLSDMEDRIFNLYKMNHYDFKEVQSDLSIELTQEILEIVIEQTK